LNRFFNRQNFEQKQVVQKSQIEDFGIAVARILSKNKLCRNIELKSSGIAVFAEKSMTCFCSAPDCRIWLKTISQKQISFTDILRSKIV
jgi:hypothetical protein